MIGLFDSQYHNSFVALQVIIGMEKNYGWAYSTLDPRDFYCQH